MILPTDLLPENVGVWWGVSLEDCLEVLDRRPSYTSDTRVVVPLLFEEGRYDVTLDFWDDGGLYRIVTHLYVCDNQPARTQAPLPFDACWVTARATYAAWLEYMADIIGLPNFSGPPGNPGYPRDQAARLVTLWKRPTGRAMLLLDQLDEESPLFISMAAQPRVLHAPPKHSWQQGDSRAI
jgi:hypothetical protein